MCTDMWILMPQALSMSGRTKERFRLALAKHPGPGASPQDCLGIMWAFSSASLKTAPKADCSFVLALYREKQSNPLGAEKCGHSRIFCPSPLLINAHSSDGTLVWGFLEKDLGFP